MPLSVLDRWYANSHFNYTGVLTGVIQGYQMAKNLQSKLKPSDKVSIFDINPESMKGLEAEMKAASTGAAVELAASAFDASKDAVSLVSRRDPLQLLTCSGHCHHRPSRTSACSGCLQVYNYRFSPQEGPCFH